MLQKLLMPKLSPTMTQGTIAKWHKKVGDKIEPGDLLLEIETDKATIEHNAMDPGWVREIEAQEGDTVDVNGLLAYVTDEKDESYEKGEEKPAPTPEKKEEKPKETPKVEIVQHTPGERIHISPLAKKLAKEQGIDVSSLKGSGPGGRIMSRDLQKKTAVVPSAPGEKTKVPMSTMRKVIAQRLTEAKQQIPHFYLKVNVDVTDLFRMRSEMKKEGYGYTVTDFIIKASSLSLMKFDEMRMSFDAKEQVLWQYPTADISLAVSVNGGLITPILFQSEKMSLDALSKEAKRLAEKARASKLKPEEFTGGCFTISNLGMYGVTEFFAIINPPQASILSVGAIEEQVKSIDGEMTSRKILPLCLAVDHRVVDGAVGAQFLQEMKKYLEKPYLLLLNS